MAAPKKREFDPIELELLWRRLISMVDELHRESVMSDATWASLASTYDDVQMIEAPMLVGFYTMLAYFFNSARVQSEEGLPAPPW